MARQEGLVCIFANGENKGSARSSPRRQRSSALHLIFRVRLRVSTKMARQEGLEPPTYCLEGSCSIQLSYWRIYGAGDGNRTRVSSLEGWCSTIELHPQILFSQRILSYYSPTVKADFANCGYFFINYIGNGTVAAFTHGFIPISYDSVSGAEGIVCAV